MMAANSPSPSALPAALPAALTAPAALRVLHVCSEVFPLLKTGGLADVTAALPPALATLGVDCRLLLPGFPAMWPGLTDLTAVVEFAPQFGQQLSQQISQQLGQQPGQTARLWRGRLASGIVCYLIDQAELYQRPGNPYQDERGQAYADNYRRFALLAKVAARLADAENAADPAWCAQILHCHDWHAALAPAYLKAQHMASGQRVAASVMTIHNLAYQGLFPRQVFGELGLPPQFNDMNGVEFYQQVSFLKAGLFFADKITTVSPTYASEIVQPEQGCGFDGLLRGRRIDLHGILNGVDPAIWHPGVDNALAQTYTRQALGGKAVCKAALQSATGLAQQADRPLFGVVSRLTEQKGLHLLLHGAPALLQQGGQLVLLGNGEPQLEAAFTELARQHPQQVALKLGFDESFAHQIMAASDVVCVPSRFEPCGLTQLYGLQYGSLPLVHRVGGLADTVTDSSLENLDDDSANGFVFAPFTQAAFDGAVRRAFALYRRPAAWGAVQQHAMAQDVSWQHAAKQYLALYQTLV
jgi:starch synthase